VICLSASCARVTAIYRGRFKSFRARIRSPRASVRRAGYPDISASWVSRVANPKGVSLLAQAGGPRGRPYETGALRTPLLP
jgi:hypothetical protein